MDVGYLCHLQLSSSVSPALRSSLVTHPTASVITALHTKSVETLRQSRSYLPTVSSFLSAVCLRNCHCNLLGPNCSGRMTGFPFSQIRRNGRGMPYLLSCICSEVRIVTCFFSFSCCAQTVHWVFACLHHSIRFYNSLLASIRVIVLDGRSEQMSASAIHCPLDIYFNFIVGAYHALVT